MNKADFEEAYAKTKFFAVVNFEAGKRVGRRHFRWRDWPVHKAEVIEYPVTWVDNYEGKHHDGVRVKLTSNRDGGVTEKVIQRKWFRSSWAPVAAARKANEERQAEHERLAAYGEYVAKEFGGKYAGRYSNSGANDIEISLTVSQVRRKKPGIMSYTKWKKAQK